MKTTLHYIAYVALLSICIHCKGAMKEKYNLLQEDASILEQQLAEADDQFNEVQANFRQAITQTPSKESEFREIESALAIQNSKLAQVDGKLELVAGLRFSEFEEKDTVLFSDLNEIKIDLHSIQNELEDIDAQIKQIKK